VRLAGVALVLQFTGTLHHVPFHHVPRSARHVVAEVDLLLPLVPAKNHLHTWRIHAIIYRLVGFGWGFDRHLGRWKRSVASSVNGDEQE